MVENLSDGDFKYLLQEFSGKQLNLVKQKGVYPYEYMNSFEMFSEDKLPDKWEFYSSLNNGSINETDGSINEKDECISEKDYLHAVNVCNKFKMKSLGDYHDLYLNTDVFLLTDVFKKFISTCLEYYTLDSCHYFSSPGLSWDVMLKVIGIEL